MQKRKQIKKTLITFLIMNVILIIALIGCYLTAWAGLFLISLAMFVVCAMIISIYLGRGLVIYEEYKD